jgi:hypothetical protein
MQINLFESIRIFIEIVESGSLTQAAENLQVHRPAVTKALQLLEQHSGTRLLQRTTRRISLTPDGEAFIAAVNPAGAGGRITGVVWRRSGDTRPAAWICPSLLRRCG